MYSTWIFGNVSGNCSCSTDELVLLSRHRDGGGFKGQRMKWASHQLFTGSNSRQRLLFLLHSKILWT